MQLSCPLTLHGCRRRPEAIHRGDEVADAIGSEVECAGSGPQQTRAVR
jgi:hypothetical protein